jgi:group I intron endonuclease
MKTGFIYKITSPSGKIYIGKTFNLSDRKSSYKGLCCKSQRILYNSIIKYGWETHVIEIINEGVYTDQELSSLETNYIIANNSYHKWNPNGMNLTLGGEGWKGQHTDETKLKISKTKKNSQRTESQKLASLKRVGTKIKKTEEWIKHNAESIKKPIIQYTIDGEFIREWKSAKDVELELGLSRKNLSCNLRGKSLSAFNYVWRYKNK